MSKMPRRAKFCISLGCWFLHPVARERVLTIIACVKGGFCIKWAPCSSLSHAGKNAKKILDKSQLATHFTSFFPARSLERVETIMLMCVETIWAKSRRRRISACTAKKCKKRQRGRQRMVRRRVDRRRKDRVRVCSQSERASGRPERASVLIVSRTLFLFLLSHSLSRLVIFGDFISSGEAPTPSAPPSPPVVPVSWRPNQPPALNPSRRPTLDAVFLSLSLCADFIKRLARELFECFPLGTRRAGVFALK